VEPQKTLKDLSVTELKALAYDQVLTIENAENALQAINAEIMTRKEAPPDAPGTP